MILAKTYNNKIQPKLIIGQPNDRFEQEADQVADQVMRMPKSQIPPIQLKCEACEEEELQMKPLTPSITSIVQKKEEEEEVLQMKRVGNEGASSSALETSLQQSKGGGQHLDCPTQSFMGKGINADFSKVKIHTDSSSVRMNRQLSAKAFTKGSEIYFNQGQYNPQSSEGKQLLAHELTHVVQQQSSLKQGGLPSIQKTGEGTSEMENIIHDSTQDADTNVWEGLIDRREFVPADGAQAERTLGTIRNLRIQYNPNNCSILLNSTLNFEHPNSGNWAYCGEDRNRPMPTTQLPQGKFDSLKERFLRLTRQRLNGWYSVRVDENCEDGCAGRTMPIIVRVVESSTNPTTTVVLANTTGRSCASPRQVTLHAQGIRGGRIQDHRIVHESGHMALGYLDEYPVAYGNPDAESVRTDDFSTAGASANFRDWMQLHERHFSFVPDFLQNVLNCNAELVELERPETTFEFNALIGGASYEEGAFALDLGLDFGVPLTRNRDLQLLLGLHGHMLMPLTRVDRTAFLVGARLGLQYTTGLSDGGFQIGAFGELGAGNFGRVPLEGSTRFTGAERITSPYAYAGGSLGYSFAPSGGTIPFIGAEAGYGSTFGLNQEQMERFGDSNWFSVGLNAGFQFR